MIKIIKTRLAIEQYYQLEFSLIQALKALINNKLQSCILKIKVSDDFFAILINRFLNLNDNLNHKTYL